MSSRWPLFASILVAGCSIDQPLDESELASAVTVAVGNEIALDNGITGSPIGLPSRSGSVAFSGAQYLAVWQDSRSGSPAIWATRMTTLGAISDVTAIRISAASLTGEQAEPAVAFINGRYLVVWEDRGTGDLRAATVTTAGIVTQQGTVGTGGNDLKPRLVARGSEALLAFESAGDVYAARFTGSSFAAPFGVAATTNPETEPAVAANPAGGYLVTFTSGAVGSRKLHGQLVDPAAASPLVGPAIGIATGWRDHFQSDASFIGGNFVVVWNYRAGRIGGARVSPTGVVLDTHLEEGIAYGGLPLSDINSDQPSIACSSATSKCFVSWRRRILGNDAIVTDVEGQLFDASLVANSAVVTVSGGLAVQGAPRVTAAASGAFFTAFNDDRHNFGGSVFGTRVSSAGAVLDASGILLPRGYNHQSAPVASRSAFTWMVSWTDSRSIGNNIVGGRINNGGMSFDVPAFTIGGAPYGQGNSAMAVNGAANAKQYMVVWSDRQNRHADVQGSSVAEVPSLQVATNVTVASGPDEQVGPEIASDPGGSYLVTWQDRRNFAVSRTDVYAAVLNSSGTVAVGDIVVSSATGEQVVPQVAHDTSSGLYLLIWVDVATNTLFGARVTPTGSVLDPDGVALVAGATSMGDLALAPGSDRLLAAWRDGTEIRGARIRISSTEIVVDDPAGFTVASGAGARKNPSIAFLHDTARTFYVVWTDGRSGNGDIYGTSVLETTGATAGAVAIATGATDETSPQLASGKPFALGQDVEVLLTYQRFDTAKTTQRVFVRKLSYSGF